VKILFDTSFLVALFESGHPRHDSVKSTFQSFEPSDAHFYVASHTLGELYAVLTTLPVTPNITPRQARDLIDENVLGSMQVLSISEEDYLKVIDDLAGNHQSGGIIYDALICRIAVKEGVDRLYTLNRSDFRRVWTGEPEVLRGG